MRCLEINKARVRFLGGGWEGKQPKVLIDFGPQGLTDFADFFVLVWHSDLHNEICYFAS
jgi:hypothetical protein